MAERDYYEVLGVARDAPDGEIKRAFRRLARELHPDVNPDPGAADGFREAAEAYEVLSDPDSRARYDRFGHAGMAGREFHTDRFMDFSSLSDLLGAFFGDDL
ncbi:MAG TPA: DnaJ domain-containing protein, partial [Gaiellales bacterium]|nr:DnaJ domain-containing protein [Gaiellales bacterium]